jgi:hypothetical protein
VECVERGFMKLGQSVYARNPRKVGTL